MTLRREAIMAMNIPRMQESALGLLRESSEYEMGNLRRGRLTRLIS